VEEVGPDDNFFELGGDSILSIQVVARARDAGLHLTPRMLFEQPTLTGLAGLVRRSEALPSAPAFSGEALLLPMQEWFFAQDFEEANHGNVAVARDAREPLELDSARLAATALLEHHDALRARFERAASGWRQEIRAPETGPPEVRWIETMAGESRE